jgi:Druantia protein DruA
MIQGRCLDATHVEQIRQLLAAHREWSRRRLSLHLALLWDWRNGAGRLKDMAARTLLLKLERRGWIALPARRQVPANRMCEKPVAMPEADGMQSAVSGALEKLLPLQIHEVSSGAAPAQRRLFEQLLHRHHYLSYRGTVGENLQYLASTRQGQPLACVLFGAPAWQCAPRDAYIGWEASSRCRGLRLIANNTRFLVVPWAEVPSLASHLLGRIARRLSRDWQAKYGHPIYLLETFVQRERFAATCYRAANWQRVGQTKGRSRQNQPDGRPYHLPLKDIYLYPLHRHFRQRLQGLSNLNPSNPFPL